MTNSTRSSARQKFVKEAAELIAQAPTLFSENKKLKENIKSVTEDRDAILNAKLRADQIIKKLKESNAELLMALRGMVLTASPQWKSGRLAVEQAQELIDRIKARS